VCVYVYTIVIQLRSVLTLILIKKLITYLLTYNVFIICCAVFMCSLKSFLTYLLKKFITLVWRDVVTEAVTEAVSFYSRIYGMKNRSGCASSVLLTCSSCTICVLDK